MTLRMAALATFIAALPLSVNAPGDSLRRSAQTRLEVAGGMGQYGIVTRGCNGEVLDVFHRDLRSGALSIEHETASGVVIGVRGGQVREIQDARTEADPFGGGTIKYPATSLTNRYMNPFVGLESRSVGIGVGMLRADHPFAIGGEERSNMELSGHFRVGPREDASFMIRLMEDMPLQTMGNVTMEMSLRPTPRLEITPVLGLAGPYDGSVIGLRGRVWLTPEAAAHVQASLGGLDQFGVAAGISMRFPGKRLERDTIPAFRPRNTPR